MTSEEFPRELRYTESDEWVRIDGDEAISGITAYASEQLGDVVYLQLPEAGRHYARGESYGEIESVKAVSDLMVPVSGTVLEVNVELEQNPSLVNEDPYGSGWIARLALDDAGQVDRLLDADAYARNTAERD